MKEILLCFVGSLAGNLLAYWLVFKAWRFPKILAVPVDKDDPCLLRFRDALKKSVGANDVKKSRI